MEKKELFEARRQRLLALLNSEDLQANRSLLAARLGISVSYVYRMLYPEGKAGKKNIGDDTVRLIAARFGGYSLDGTSSADGLSETALMVGRAFDRLSDVQKTALLGVLQGFGWTIKKSETVIAQPSEIFGVDLPASQKQSFRSS